MDEMLVLSGTPPLTTESGCFNSHRLIAWGCCRCRQDRAQGRRHVLTPLLGRDQARYAGTLRSSEPFTSLPSAYDLGGENPYIDTKDVLKLLNCGRLDRQAAGHPWSALRVVKSCRKTAQRPRCCSKLKQQLCIQNGTRAHYLNYLQRGRVRLGKEAQAIRLASQSDRQQGDRQTGGRQT